MAELGLDEAIQCCKTRSLPGPVADKLRQGGWGVDSLPPGDQIDLIVVGARIRSRQITRRKKPRVEDLAKELGVTKQVAVNSIKAFKAFGGPGARFHKEVQ